MTTTARKGASWSVNASWMLIGNLAYGFSQWAILVIITRFGSTEMAGQYAVAMAIATPILLFASLQLRQIQATDPRRHYKFADYSATRLSTSLAGIVLVFAGAVLSGFAWPLVAITLCLAVWRTAENFADICYGQFQQDERMDIIGKSKLIRSILFVSILAGTFLAFKDLRVASLSLTLASLGLLFTFDWWFLRRHLEAHGDRPGIRSRSATIRELVVKALPLGILILVMSLEAQLPRYLVHQFHGDRAVGIFAALAFTTAAVQTVVITVNQATLTPLGKAYFNGNKKGFLKRFARLLTFAVGLAIAAVVGGILLGETFLGIAFGDEFARQNEIFVLLLVAFGLQVISISFQVAARAMQQNWWPLFVRMTGFAVLVILGLVLVPEQELRGAAIAAIAGAAVSASLFIIIGSYSFRKTRFPT